MDELLKDTIYLRKQPMGTGQLILKIVNHINEKLVLKDLDINYDDCSQDKPDECFYDGYSKGYAKALMEINKVLKS